MRPAARPSPAGPTTMQEGYYALSCPLATSAGSWNFDAVVSVSDLSLEFGFGSEHDKNHFKSLVKSESLFQSESPRLLHDMARIWL